MPVARRVLKRNEVVRVEVRRTDEKWEWCCQFPQFRVRVQKASFAAHLLPLVIGVAPGVDNQDPPIQRGC